MYENLKSEKVTEKITLYNCDCMELLKQTPDNYYSLAIIDPPYDLDINKHSFVSKQHKNKEGLFFQQKTNMFNSTVNDLFFKELFRVSKHQIIWGGNYFIEYLYKSSCWIVWHKKNIGNRFADAELAWCSFNTSIRVFEKTTDTKNRIHINQKPVELYKWLLDKYAKQGDKILDTHSGSASLAIACHDYGFELTACELDSDYFDASIKRIKNHISQLTFDFNE